MNSRALYVLAFAVATTLFMLLVTAVVQRLGGGGGGGAAATAANPAQRLMRAGQILAVFLVAASSVANGASTGVLADDARWVLFFGGAGIALVELSGLLGARLILKHRLREEIARGNVAAGIAAGASFVATGILTAHALSGRDVRTLGLSLVFWVLAQVALHVTVALFRALTSYDDAEQIHGENAAAALSYGGALVALAIVVGRASDGEFETWPASLRSFGMVLLTALVLYPARQIVVQGLVLRAPITVRGGKLDTAIATDRNVPLAALEAIVYVAAALSVAHLA
jgi:uncharacterized membrane protein YjfL (UPF0719 family)